MLTETASFIQAFGLGWGTRHGSGPGGPYQVLRKRTSVEVSSLGELLVYRLTLLTARWTKDAQRNWF